MAALQIAGALMILIPFVWSQRGSMATDSAPYLVLNLAGSGCLAILAALGSQWGFLLLEGSWAAVSAQGLARRAKRHTG